MGGWKHLKKRERPLGWVAPNLKTVNSVNAVANCCHLTVPTAVGRAPAERQTQINCQAELAEAVFKGEATRVIKRPLLLAANGAPVWMLCAVLVLSNYEWSFGSNVGLVFSSILCALHCCCHCRCTGAVAAP